MENHMQVERVHVRPRVELFIPLRVAGAPGAKTILSARITIGKFVDSNNTFVFADSWTCRGTAHRALERPWIGRTIFIRKSNDDAIESRGALNAVALSAGNCMENGLNSHPALTGSHAGAGMSREELQFLSPFVGRSENLHSPMHHDRHLACASLHCSYARV